MTETQLRTERPPVRPRSGRRPIPPLVFLLVLALTALVVWWNVLGDEAERRAAAEEDCTSASAPIPRLDPATVSVRVLNSSDLRGRAGLVADALSGRGFTIAEVGNDGTGRDVSGPGEVRYGPLGREAARFVLLQQPGATLYEDTRANETVDLVIGPEWQQLAPQAQIEEALAAQDTAAPATC